MDARFVQAHKEGARWALWLTPFLSCRVVGSRLSYLALPRFYRLSALV